MNWLSERLALTTFNLAVSQIKLLEVRELKTHDKALPNTEHDDGLSRVRSEKLKYAVSCHMLSQVVKGRILWG